MKFEKIERAYAPELDKVLGEPIDVLDHGFVRVIDYMGNSSSVVQAARVSYGKGTKTVNEDRGLINYLLRNMHTSPFEMCEIKFHMKLPIFVARQIVRQRTASLNEMSARYSVLANEFYIPDLKDIAAQSTKNHQGRSDESLPTKVATNAKCKIAKSCDNSFLTYESLLEDDSVARELSRSVLPLSTYTEWYWKIDLNNLIKFLKLRMDSHAQYETRMYANVMANFTKLWVPEVYDAADEYVFNSTSLSRTAKLVISNINKGASIEDALMSIKSKDEKAKVYDLLIELGF